MRYNDVQDTRKKESRIVKNEILWSFDSKAGKLLASCFGAIFTC